jgi:hypothetical protein
MTIGIITPLPDGVLFVAEGRQTNLSTSEESIASNDVTKIYQIAPDVVVITFSISGVTAHFLETLRQNFDVPNVRIGNTHEEIVGAIDQLLERVWQRITFPPGTDFTHANITAGFGVGGLASGVPFVGVSIRSKDLSIALLASDDQRARIVIGGNNCNPRQLYIEHERRELGLYDAIDGNTEPTIYAVIRAAAKAIREVERYDPGVGGTIRYSYFTGAPNINPMISGTYTDPV